MRWMLCVLVVVACASRPQPKRDELGAARYDASVVYAGARIEIRGGRPWRVDVIGRVKSEPGSRSPKWLEMYLERRECVIYDALAPYAVVRT